METFGGGSVVKDFAGTFVEHILDGTKFLVRDSGEIEATGEVVAEAVVLAFAGGAFPGAVGVTEVDFEFEVGGELGVLGHFLSLVVGEREAQLGGQVGEFALERLAHAGGVFFREVTQEHEAGGAFDEDADGGGVAGAHDEVAFEVAGGGAGLDLGRAVVDERHVLKFALRGEGAAGVGFTLGVVAAQAGDELAFERPARDDVNVAVDGFVRGVHGGIGRVLPAQGAGNLFGRPAAAQSGEQGGKQRGMGRDRAEVAPRRAGTGGGALLSAERPVVVAPAIEREFAAERAGRAAEALRDEGLRVAPAQGPLQLSTLVRN